MTFLQVSSSLSVQLSKTSARMLRKKASVNRRRRQLIAFPRHGRISHIVQSIDYHSVGDQHAQ
jgi:hypothetical protein